MFTGNAGSFRGTAAPIMNAVPLDATNAAYDQSQNGINQQQAFVNALQAQNGIGNQGSVFNQQQALANQLQGVANGTGPNPALQQLQNTTGQNMANQAAMMAGQRGAQANVGLMARQNAMQGGNLQQQAAGQGAALGAQQQLAGMNALQAQQGQMAGLANTQVGQQANALTGYNQATQGQQSNLLGALGQYNNANVAMQSNLNTTNAGIQQGVMGQENSLMGGLASGGGSAAMLMAAKGGEVSEKEMIGPRSKVGQHLKMAKGGMLPLSGDAYAAKGKVIPGKAEVKGDSLKNDKVPAVLSPGEVVLPRSVMNAADPAGEAAKFVAAIQARKGKK